MTTRRLVTAVVVIGLGLSACSTGTGQSDKRGCREFRSAVSDQADGVSTQEEFRSAVQGADEDIRVSDDATLVAASRAMVAAATSGDIADVGIAAKGMFEACQAKGY